MQAPVPYTEPLQGKPRKRILKKRMLAERMAAHHKTSFLILEEAEIERSIASFRRWLPFARLFYAVKANDSAPMLQKVAAAGLSFDVASAGEVRELLQRGVPGYRMILANPEKTPDSLHTMFAHGLGACTFDSVSELDKIRDYHDRQRRLHVPRLLLRLQTHSAGVWTDLSLKFGCPPDQALELLRAARERGMPAAGLAFHVGTQSFDVDNYRRALDACRALLQRGAHLFANERLIIDIGGGFPNDSRSAAGQLGLEAFYRELAEMLEPLRREGFELWAEPGRVLSGPAGTLVTHIIGRREADDQVFLYLDDGVYGGYSALLFDHAQFVFFPLSRRHYAAHARADLRPYTLAGPTCDAVDIIAPGVMLPASIDVGDALFTTDIGAYSTVSATRFNRFRIPPTLFVERGSPLYSAWRPTASAQRAGSWAGEHARGRAACR